MKNHESILIYGITYKTFAGVKPLLIRLDEVYGDLLKIMMELNI